MVIVKCIGCLGICNEKLLSVRCGVFSVLLPSFRLYVFASERSGLAELYGQMPKMDACAIAEECTAF